jgi:hypothetical protein
MENHRQSILDVASTRGINSAFLEFSARIATSPKKRNRTNVYNSFTPQGAMTTKNDSYRTQIQEWKKYKLFPYFLELGFTKEEISSAWKTSLFMNGRSR